MTRKDWLLFGAIASCSLAVAWLMVLVWPYMRVIL